MVCSSTIRNCVPPILAVHLLEVVLPPQSTNNVIGDLVEEFCIRVHRDGLRCTQRWFWLQALRTSRISIREGWVVHRVIGEATRWRLIAFSLAVFALLMFYYFSLESIRIDRELQIQVASNNFELTVLPPMPSRSNASQTYNNNRLKTNRKFSAVSYQLSTAREKSKYDKRPLTIEAATETAGSASPTDTFSAPSRTIYPFYEPGMNIKSDSSQSASVSSTQERGCFR